MNIFKYLNMLAAALALSAEIHDKCAARWKELEAKYWSMFGRGF